MIKNYVWEKFWRLTVIEESPFRYLKSWRKKRFVLCKCDCWTIKDIVLDNVRSWQALSCWCYNKEMTRKSNSKHMMANTNFYLVYRTMKGRCSNKNVNWYRNYWWRWIKCLRNSFEEFRDDMYKSYLEHKEKNYWNRQTTIERIDNDWNYCKENCRWATYKEQALNKNVEKDICYKYPITKMKYDTKKRLRHAFIPIRNVDYE